MSDNHTPKEKIVVRAGQWISETEPRSRFIIPAVMLLLCGLFFALGNWYHGKTDPDFDALEKASQAEKDSLKTDNVRLKNKAKQSQADAEVYAETAVRWKAKHDAVKKKLDLLTQQHEKQDARLDTLSYDELDRELFSRYGETPGGAIKENQ